jgi:anti-sigma factor RsiW
MIDPGSAISEEELHAFVDGELPDDRKALVAAWLNANPEQAAAVAAWRAQADAIRARYGAVANEPIPDRLNLARVMRGERAIGFGRSWMSIAAAALVAFTIGGAAGWIAHGAAGGAGRGFDSIAADALDAYKLYVVEVRHPVEVPGSERAHMTQWLSKRLGSELRIPDLQSIGLKLVGGRLLPGPSGAAAFYMYESASGERYTIYCAKSAVPETALRFTDGGGAAAFFWVDDKIAYVVSGPADRERLESVTKTVYEQIDKSGAKKS